jgi:hypothetical protein
MRITTKSGALRLLGWFVIAIMAVTFFAACKSPEKTAETAAKKEDAVAAESISLSALADPLGKAEAEKSGVFDATMSDNQLQVTYHFYTPERKDIDDDIGIEMAPKIRAMYKAFKTIDRVAFRILVMRWHVDTMWTPYCSFVVTRKIVQETDWTKLLDTEFFKAVLELTYDR